MLFSLFSPRADVRVYGRNVRLVREASAIAAVGTDPQAAAAVGDIAEFLRCDRSNVSHLVERASGRGLVQRRATETDGRIKLVELSPEGEEVVRHFIQTLGSRFEVLLADWPNDRREDAITTLYALADLIERARRGEADQRNTKPALHPFP